MTIFSVEVLVKEARIIELESMWPLTKTLGHGLRDSIQVHAHGFLRGSPANLVLNLLQVGILLVQYVPQLS